MKVNIYQLERENSYDLLRIASTIAVISIHVSAVWLSANTSDAEFGTMLPYASDNHLPVECDGAVRSPMLYDDVRCTSSFQ